MELSVVKYCTHAGLTNSTTGRRTERLPPGARPILFTASLQPFHEAPARARLEGVVEGFEEGWDQDWPLLPHCPAILDKCVADLIPQEPVTCIKLKHCPASAVF